MLMRVDLPLGRASPICGEVAHNPLDRLSVGVAGTEVPGGGETRAAGVEFLCEREIAAQRLEHMLPGRGSGGVADLELFPAGEGAHDVGDEAIGGPVAAAYDISRAGGCQRDVVL